ncbi:MAG: hypothetical protein AAB821_00315 [Patescibacteria group bacterium]
MKNSATKILTSIVFTAIILIGFSAWQHQALAQISLPTFPLPGPGGNGEGEGEDEEGATTTPTHGEGEGEDEETGDDDTDGGAGEGEGEEEGEQEEDEASQAAEEAERDAREAIAEERKQDEEELGKCEQEYDDVKEKNGSGKYVPVKEVEGSLMQFTRDINQQTGDIKLLNIQMCMHLKALKRVAYKYEIAEFLEKPQLRAIAGLAVDQYKKELFSMVKSGAYKSDFMEDSPLFVDDMDAYIAEGNAEATARVLDGINKSGSKYRSLLDNALMEKSSYKSTDDFSCPVTLEDIVKANDPESDMSNSQKLDVLLYVKTIPGCSFRGSYNLMTKLIDNEIDREQIKRQEEYIASGGYKPIRECVNPVNRSAGDICLKWRTTVPVSSIKDVVGTALSANLNRYLNAQPGDIDKENKNGPQLSEFLTLTSSHSGDTAYPTGSEEEGQLNSGLKPGTGESGGGTGDDDTPGGSDDTGGGGGNDDEDFNLAELLEDYFNFRLPGDPDVPDEETMRNLEIRPLIFAYFRLPTEGDLVDDPFLSNAARISWFSLNAEKCEAGNNWLEGNIHDDAVDVIEDVGDKLEPVDNTIVNLPLAFNIYLKREREVVVDNNIIGPDETETDTDYMPITTQIVKQLYQTSTIDFDNFDAKENDIFTLGIKQDSGGFEEVVFEVSDHDAPTEVVAEFKTAIEVSGADNLQNYRFDYSLPAHTISISTEPKYTIVCENEQGQTSKTVTVVRQ